MSPWHPLCLTLDNYLGYTLMTSFPMCTVVGRLVCGHVLRLAVCLKPTHGDSGFPCGFFKKQLFKFWFYLATSGLSCGPGIKPASSGLEGEVLTTGSPGKSLHVLLTAFLSDRIVVRILKDFPLWYQCLHSGPDWDRRDFGQGRWAKGFWFHK